MEMLLKNGFVYTDNDFVKADLLIKDGRIIDIAENIDVCCDVVYNLNNLYIRFCKTFLLSIFFTLP